MSGPSGGIFFDSHCSVASPLMHRIC